MTAPDANTTRRAEVDGAPERKQPGPLEFSHAAWRLPAAALAGDCGEPTADRSSPGHRKRALFAIVDHAGLSVWAMHVATIAAETGDGEASVRRALRWLECTGWITRERMHRDDGRPGIYAYRANVEAIVAAGPRARARGTGTGDRSSPVQGTAREGDQSAGGPLGLGPVPSNPPGRAPTQRSADVDSGGVFADADEPPAVEVDAEPLGPEPVGAEPAAAAPPSEPSGDGPAGDRQARRRGAGAAPSAPPEVSADAVALIEAYCDLEAPTPAEILADSGNGKHRPAAASFEILVAYGPVDAQELADFVAGYGAGEVEIRDAIGWARFRLHEACREPERFVRRPRPAPRDCAAHGHDRVAELDAVVGRCLDCGADLDLDDERGRL